MYHLQHVDAVHCTESSKKIKVLSDLTLDICQGDRITIVGPLGSGKSTLLHLLAGLHPAENGVLLYKGEVLKKTPEDVAVVLQDHGLLEWKTVYRNAVLGLELNGNLTPDTERLAIEVLTQLNLLVFKDCYPRELTVGQRQLAALARALVMHPKTLLLDEPLSELDISLQESAENLLLEFLKQRDFTMVCITHSIEEAVFLGQKIWLMEYPGIVGEIVENPHPENSGFRESHQFFEMCRRLKQKVISREGSGEQKERIWK
ncbi:Aliphatic sulfonates import ATP-binding protein SsuB [uncultured Roseburia sp.]|uniref:ATP-binding cassette domain-containing protein n=1 Tax=Brotonthovivens ammoniilytica TaxID=2981725 RepID=A0ABT2TLW8_9FIRM|nr:ATP-binding cassette domain-containing protein [Brotonthovivens ammoniilytica]MCU6762806.1 ATP-binding cassette domain-containing protein [Brotonthovivens ammoniilytica]SCI89585.1 Aliphatic sulfonates import ATP-binding protein SsuB [uncultured Roseburia sp.]